MKKPSKPLPKNLPPMPSNEFVPMQGGPMMKDLLAMDTATSDQARAEIVKSLMNSDNIEMVTDLSPEEIFQVSTLSALNMNVKSEVVDKFLVTFLKTKVSKNRLGRREGIEIGKPDPIGNMDQGHKPFWKFWA